jgi:iron complex outermembrane receptor protein
MDHETTSLALFLFDPAQRLLHLYNGFIQDELTLVPDRLRLTLGSKFEHNDYTDWEIQPSARLAWTPTAQHTIWAAVSRAVRTPSRVDRDFFLYLAPGTPLLVGSDFQSEKVVAYEAGWRLQPSARLSVSLSPFYNGYDDLRTAAAGPPPQGIPIVIENGLRGHTYGVELATAYQVNDHWRLRGGYTFLKKKLSLKPGRTDLNGGRAESDDPEHGVVLQSTADVTGRLALDAVVRYVDALPNPDVASYVGLDLRLGWQLTPRLEVAVVGQNLLQDRHPEFRPSSPSPRDIERGVYGKITWR